MLVGCGWSSWCGRCEHLSMIRAEPGRTRRASSNVANSPSLDVGPDAHRAGDAGHGAEAESGAGGGGDHFRLVGSLKLSDEWRRVGRGVVRRMPGGNMNIGY